MSQSINVPQSLLALDTDHIKKYVLSTNKLKEIRGASSLLDRLNRGRRRQHGHSIQTVYTYGGSTLVLMDAGQAESPSPGEYSARTIYAYGGSALFLVDSSQAESLGKAFQKLYHEATSGGASITYAIQPVPHIGTRDQIMTAKLLEGGVTMQQLYHLLGVRLQLAKATLQMKSGPPQISSFQDETAEYRTALALPSYMLFSPCSSCGIEYAEDTRYDPDDPGELESYFCQVCIHKRDEDQYIKQMLWNIPPKAVSRNTLWGRILKSLQEPRDVKNPLYNQPYRLPERISRPKDFHAFSDVASGRGYLGLICADANGMGQAMKQMETLQEIAVFARQVDDAVFAAMGDAIRQHLPMQQKQPERLPFDVLLVGGDDIALVTPAAQAPQVAATLAERFEFYIQRRHTLSVSVILAPITYPFGLQHKLADEALKASKKAGAQKRRQDQKEPELSHINFVVMTGNTSLNYASVYESMHSKKGHRQEYFATLRPYTLPDFQWLLAQLRSGNQQHLGRTKMHQLREAILKIDRSTAATILEALALLRNWKPEERKFVKDLVKQYDKRLTSLQEEKGTIFPWGIDGLHSTEESLIYVTPLLDFIELYDFVS